MFFFLVFFFSHAGGWPYRLTKCCHFNWRLFIRRFRPGYVVCQIPLSYTVAFALGGCFLSSCDLAILFGVLSVGLCPRTRVCLYVCMYVCMHVCMRVCVCVCVCVCALKRNYMKIEKKLKKINSSPLFVGRLIIP